jgi:hypothetical protein
MPWWGRAVL